MSEMLFSLPLPLLDLYLHWTTGIYIGLSTLCVGEQSYGILAYINNECDCLCPNSLKDSLSFSPLSSKSPLPAQHKAKPWQRSTCMSQIWPEHNPIQEAS